MKGSLASFALPCLALLSIACGSKDAPATTAPPVVTPPSGNAISLAVGASTPVVAGSPAVLAGGTGGEFVLVVTDTLTNGATAAISYTLGADGTAVAGSVSGPATSRAPLAMTPGTTLTRDDDYGARLNARAYSRLRPLMHAARESARASARLDSRSLAAVPQVGDIVNYNVGEVACDSSVTHPTRIVAVGSKAIVAVDTLNPPSGFTATDFQRFAANFDTLVYPLDVANFGEPSDIDGNGHVVLLFTRAVNELTPRNSESYVGGFFFSRDLFPRVASATVGACKTSNFSELFYLLAPDPQGAVNGNIRTTGFVDSLVNSLLAHEFQHLINGSRRLYVNNADDFEAVWLNEGLSHIAEELLFYRQAVLTPRQNISSTILRTRAAIVSAFNADQSSNAARYREYLIAPSANSPIRNDDSLSTRGATWDLLRYAADRKLGSSSTNESTIWQALVNSASSGIPNLRAVFGADVGGMLRDWSVSQYADDLVAGAPVEFTQPSWNWHSVFLALGANGSYPLAVTPLTATGTSGTVIPGGAAFYRFAVSANGQATLRLTAPAGATGVLLRVR